MDAMCRKYRQRMDAAVKQIAAQVVGYADRRKFAEILLARSAETGFPEFPWSALWDRVRTKCAEIAGLTFSRQEADDARDEETSEAG